MTQRHLIELLQERAPEKGDVYLRILMNDALREFCEETRLLSGTATIAADGTAFLYALPADCIQAKKLVDADGKTVIHSAPHAYMLLPTGAKVWWTEHGQLYLAKTVFSTTTGVGVSTAAVDAANYTLHYVKHATALTTSNLDAEIDLPSALHGAIEARVTERIVPLLERPYWFSRWKDYLRRGKRWHNEGQDGGGYNILIPEI